MKHIRMLLIICLIIQLLTSSSCAHTPSPYEYDYPRGISPKYCFENYKLFDPNIKYTECYEFVVPWTKSERKGAGMFGLGSVNYSAIKDIPDLSFMVCHRYIGWFGANIDVFLVRHNAVETDPISDYTVARIELCTYNDVVPIEVEIGETYYKYAENAFFAPILTVDSPEAVEAILSVARRPAVMSREEADLERKEYPLKYDLKLKSIYSGEAPLYVRISFVENEGLIWIGQLLSDAEGHVYLERYSYRCESEAELCIQTDFGDAFAAESSYPLGESMDEIVRGITSE